MKTEIYKVVRKLNTGCISRFYSFNAPTSAPDSLQYELNETTYPPIWQNICIQKLY